MKKLILTLAILAAGVFYYQEQRQTPRTLMPVPEAAEAAAQSETDAAHAEGRSDIQVKGVGQVFRLLPDDHKGSRHQRFLLRLDSGLTVLVAHNIDLAPRIASLQVGDSVEYFGEYEWNEKGGVVHWTHHDPRGSHVGGWLRHKDQVYQ